MSRVSKVNADPRTAIVNNNVDNNMEETAMVNVNNEVIESVAAEEVSMDVVKAMFNVSDENKPWIEVPDVNFLNIGNVVVVKKVSPNTKGKTKFTVNLCCERKGKNGGIYYTFHNLFTDEVFKVGDKKIVINVGKQWSNNITNFGKKMSGNSGDVYISKNAKLEDCNIKTESGFVFKTKVRASRVHKAVMLGLR